MTSNPTDPPEQPIGPAVSGWTAPQFPERLSLEGQIVRLQPLDATAHAADLFASFSQDSEGIGWTYLPYGPFATIEAFVDWVVSVASGDEPQFYAVILKSSGVAVGITSYLRIDPPNGSIEVGHIHFSQSIKRSPVTTEAMFLMMKRVFESGYRRYEWKCDALNAASCSAAQRLGFSFEGIFRQATVYKGRNRDTAWFAVIDTDWPKLERAFVHWLAPDNFDGEGRQRESLSDLTRGVLKPPAVPKSLQESPGTSQG